MIGIHRANPWGQEVREEEIGEGFVNDAPHTRYIKC